MVDLAFIGIDLVFNVMGLNPLSSMQVDRDRSVPEFYQYIKLAWCVTLVVQLGWVTRSWQPVFWAPLFTLLLATDAVRIHEQAGGWLATVAHLPALQLPALGDLRPQDLGEVIVAVAFVLPSVALIALTWSRASIRARRFHLTITALMGLLATFGLLFDALHSVASDPRTQQVFALLEDGGEMLTVSALLAFLLAALASGKDVWLGTLFGRGSPTGAAAAGGAGD